MNEFSQHQDSKSQEMQALERIGQAFIITGQAAKTSHPAKGTLDDPTTRQQDKALLGIRQLDHDQLNALLSGGLFRVVTGIALVNEGHFDALVGDVLDLLSHFRDLGTVLFTSWSDMQ